MTVFIQFFNNLLADLIIQKNIHIDLEQKVYGKFIVVIQIIFILFISYLQAFIMIELGTFDHC